ncbi:uncharacterized protein LOC109838249 [Asparagus officinalis]|uniref:uncharacterized protein LOC109838249 n=1 Tax=Asparagus officinalis TaxID=4686 RepID=UPI00098E366F|nr:uncharacterized protein LOC109838249 [Asparagus officinalis]
MDEREQDRIATRLKKTAKSSSKRKCCGGAAEISAAHNIWVLKFHQMTSSSGKGYVLHTKNLLGITISSLLPVTSSPMAIFSSSTAIKSAEKFSWCCALFFAFLLLVSYCESEVGVRSAMSHGRPPCEEIYVVGEGETLHSISDKCGDPFIVEENPQIKDDGDVYPGLVLKITHFVRRN